MAIEGQTAALPETRSPSLATVDSDEQHKSPKAVASGRRCPDSFLFLEGVGSRDLPVDGARLYNLAVTPVPVPCGKMKLVVLPVFWLVCFGWGTLQRQAQLHWHVAGEPGQRVVLERSLPGSWQVLLNAVCVVALSAYAICAYLLSQTTMAKVLNPLFIPRTWAGHVGVYVFMSIVAVASSLLLRSNWVVGAAGLFLFIGWALCGRTVQESSSSRGQVGLGPSRAEADIGMSCHRDGASVEAGLSGERTFKAQLLAGDAGYAASGSRLRFATVQAEPEAIGDDAVLLEQGQDGTFTYHGPCGRANIFRWDCLLVLIGACGMNLSSFVIGAGSFNQCAGLFELLSALIYVPVGYSCFAVWGFRLGLACKGSAAIVMIVTLWPVMNLMLGGKGCTTLVHLVDQEYLPQIWSPEAAVFEFNRGFATCTESAYALGGETLLVASTTIAAWVHIMSNFSFLFGFVSGLVRKHGSTAMVDTETSITVA
mmetsp:Transcript_26451/g.66540  ORF Transcript_26451/g.66540 Transcript_26451/m.66540 type:complete len:482 (+) Transcript_26451:77-1522(+)